MHLYTAVKSRLNSPKSRHETRLSQGRYIFFNFTRESFNWRYRRLPASRCSATKLWPLPLVRKKWLQSPLVALSGRTHRGHSHHQNLPLEVPDIALELGVLRMHAMCFRPAPSLDREGGGSLKDLMLDTC